MLIALFRAAIVIWFLGAFVLAMVAVADLLFGNGRFEERLLNLLPRVAVAVVWPLAILTPRGRYLLWARWRAP